MKISSKLMLIVILTIFEISITVFSVLEVAKGASFHNLNSLHLKYSYIFLEQVDNLTPEKIEMFSLQPIKKTIKQIQLQPEKCLDKINVVDELLMKKIGTYVALDICEKDIQDANNALKSIQLYEKKSISTYQLLVSLHKASKEFRDNSRRFEQPITDTVTFIVNTMVPLVIIISVFNILFITYMSRSISGSIHNVIGLLTKKNRGNSLTFDINQNVSGEIKELLHVAQARMRDDALKTEINEKLEYLVERRTEALTQANDELSQFAYRTSHDLKSPITSTKGLARFIIQDIDRGELTNAKNDTQRIINLMEKLEVLVLGILGLTEADADIESTTEIDFKQILAEIDERQSDLIENYRCEVIKNINTDKPVYGSQVRLTQILDNLISNGIKYSNTDKKNAFVKIDIKTESDYCLIVVSDNGLGIPDDRKHEVFQMFKRFHPDVSFGSGLGMSIVKKHVKKMNGEVIMKTSANGSQFTITFPIEVTT